MAQDEGKQEEEKFDFTREGEAIGYISLDQARILAMRTAREAPGDYGNRFANTNMAFEVVEDTETEDHYSITLSFRPQGQFSGRPGQEQFFIEKEGNVAHRQVLGLPRRRSIPLVPATVGVLIVGVIVAVVAVFALGGSENDNGAAASGAASQEPSPTVSAVLSASAAPTPSLTAAAREMVATPTSITTDIPTPTRAPAPTAVPAPTRAPAPTAAPAPTRARAPTTAPTATAAPPAIRTIQGLARVAARLAGGPGAIYVGDLSQLAGPASLSDLGGFDGGVPLASLQRHSYIYESDYYRSLLDKARFTNPTPLLSQGERITIQHACINRALLPCQLIDSFFGPNLLARTNGQIDLVVSSFPELGLAGPDTLTLVEDGTLDMANIYGGYVGGEIPAMEIQVLWGVYPDLETEFAATALLTPDLEKLVTDSTGGVLLNHNWFSGNDQFLFTKKPLRTLADFGGLKTRSHSAALSDWIEGMGAEAQFVAFSEVYTALERGILDAGVTGAWPAYGQRWYEVADYINGPLVSSPSTNNVINGNVWSRIPQDLQQIMLEEGARSELEALRIASIQNEVWVERNVRAGLEFVQFSPEVQAQSDRAVISNVIPGWIRRLGGANHPIINVFNEKVGPLVGLRINANGSVTRR